MHRGFTFVFSVLLLAIPSSAASRQRLGNASPVDKSLKEPQVADDQMHSGEEEADFHISRPLYDSHLMPLTSGLEGYAKPPESNFSSAEVDIEKLIRKGRRRNKRGAISTLKNLFRKPKLAKFLVIAIVLAVAYFFNDLLNSILRILFIGWLALKAVELLD